MKRSRWLVALLLSSALRVFGQEQVPSVEPPTIKLVALTLVVEDYDKAARWYADNLGFEVRDNKNPNPEKRWVAMFSKASPELQIFLLKPGSGYMPVAKDLSPDRIGKETFWILRTNDFDGVVEHLKRNGVHFRSEVYKMGGGGKEIVIEDLYGNLWVLQQTDSKT